MNPPLANRGFTLIELLVSIGIFTIMTSAVLANYRSFDINARFANAAEDVVLALRQAQVYGVGVKKETVSGSFTMPYGVYFEQANPSQIKIFADTNGNNLYDTSPQDTIIETIKWQGGIAVSANGLACDSAAGQSKISILFNRPNPDAVIKDHDGFSCSTGKITLTNGTKSSVITVSKAGQISLQSI